MPITRELPLDLPEVRVLANRVLEDGTLLIEVIYSYPGIGNLMVDAVRNADLPLIQASVDPCCSCTDR